MSFDFSGARVLVAGGSRGIGHAFALQFARAGAPVSICARGAASLNAAREALGPASHAQVCDLADTDQLTAWVQVAAAGRGHEHPQAVVDLGLSTLGACGRRCGGQGGDVQLHEQPGGDAGRQGIRVNAIAPGSVEFPGDPLLGV
ncbi:MAG: SDR family NAD(P)-dependent oxidoreductase [Inhella sp.]